MSIWIWWQSLFFLGIWRRIRCKHMIVTERLTTNNYSCRSGHQRRSDRAWQDSHCRGLCWDQVYSGHWSHPWIPCKNSEIIFQKITHFGKSNLCFSFECVLLTAEYALATFLYHIGWDVWLEIRFPYWLFPLLCIFNQETHGVCVATYGKSKNFPAFFSPQSGFTSPCQVSNPAEAAKLIGTSTFYILKIVNFLGP